MTRHRTAQFDAYIRSVGLILARVVYQAPNTRGTPGNGTLLPWSGLQIILFVLNAAGLAPVIVEQTQKAHH